MSSMRATSPRLGSAKRVVARNPRAKVELSHDAICAAALALLDEDGLDEFSTRKLGRKLGCEAMAIYWYYPSKEALLDAVVDRLVAPIGLVAGAPSSDWVAVLRQVAHAYRRIAHDHPKAFPLLATRRFASPGTFGFLEQLFELARRQQISDQTVARFYRIVSSYCSGFALNELAEPRGTNDPAATALRHRFPRVSAVFTWLEPQHLDETFSVGLELLLDSLARTARAERRK
jgi:AcrR family transcriptional regulator